MTNPNLFKLTEKDKLHYKNLIENVDINLKSEILLFI